MGRAPHLPCGPFPESPLLVLVDVLGSDPDRMEHTMHGFRGSF